MEQKSLFSEREHGHFKELNVVKSWLNLVILIALLFTAIPVEAKGKEVYIAIGDSLAAGQTPNQAIDAGYTDLIAQELQRAGRLSYFSKALSFPGYTTSQVLESIQTEEAAELLKNATVVTVSAGANDLLRLVQVKSGTVSYQQIPADFALNGVRKNLEKIIHDLKELAPKADIYIMGYYDAYPHVSEKQKVGLKEELSVLHQILRNQAEKAGAKYVPVEETFNGKEKELVPNVSDVHPSMEGYRIMANTFFTQYDSRLSVVKTELPEPNPLTFEEIIQAGQRSTEGGVTRSPMNGYLSLTELKAYT